MIADFIASTIGWLISILVSAAIIFFVTAGVVRLLTSFPHLVHGVGCAWMVLATGGGCQ